MLLAQLYDQRALSNYRSTSKSGEIILQYMELITLKQK